MHLVCGINIQMKLYVNALTIHPTSLYWRLDSKLWGQLRFIFNLFQLWSFQRYSWMAAVIVATAESPPCSVTPSASARALNKGSRRFSRNFKIRVLSWLKAPTSAFTFKTLCLLCDCEIFALSSGTLVCSSNLRAIRTRKRGEAGQLHEYHFHVNTIN